MILIKSIRFLILIAIFYSTVSWASCPTFTAKQDGLIRQAYYTGAIENLGYTLSAIVIQESYVGSYIVRINGNDGKLGSYGVTQVGLSTAMWLEGETNVWKAKAEIAPLLVKNDTYALNLAMRKLLSVRKGEGTATDWKALWASYNGSGKAAENYSKKIHAHVKMLQRCFDFH